MMKQFLGLIVSIALVSSATAQTFGPGPGGAIPDSPSTGLNTTINVASTNTIVSFNWVEIDVSTPHTWIGDLVLTLTAPNGDNVHLMRRLGATSSGGFGSGGDWLVGTHRFVEGTGANLPTSGNVAPGTWNRTSASSQATPPFDPDGFSVFNGDSLTGTWTLNLRDFALGDTGAISGWRFNVDSVPEPSSMLLVLGSTVLLGFTRRRS